MAFVVDETYGQYCPEISPERITFRYSRAWPNATAVLTKPAVFGIVRAAEEAQAIHVRRSGYSGTVATTIVLTGTVAALEPFAKMARDESRTPTTRIAYHKALDATWRDATTQRKFKKNFKAFLASGS